MMEKILGLGRWKKKSENTYQKKKKNIKIKYLENTGNHQCYPTRQRGHYGREQQMNNN